MKNVRSEGNVYQYFSRHSYKDLLKVKEGTHYVGFVADDATPNALTIVIIKKATKNHKLLRQVVKLEDETTVANLINQ